MAEIVLDHITKRYADGTVAVDDFDLRIADHEFVILVGPSGCGKSTTLNMIAGLEDITDGELRIDGRRMNEKAPRDRDIAMVFQSYALYPHMTVRENIAFPLKLAKMDRAAIQERVERAAGLLDLAPYLDRKPAALSGGQRQRVAMGRAIVRDPKAFLMDEPLSNLDAKLRVQMRTSISRLQKSLGTTTVYVTHDQTEAMTLGDRIVIMRAGLIQQIGPPQELYDHPRNLFVAGFIGSPSMNVLPARLEEGALRTAIGDIPLRGRLGQAARGRDVPREVIAGIRPESFEDAALVHDADGGGTFTGTVDLLESMGPEKLAYFTLGAAAVRSEHLADTGGEEAAEGTQLVAQLDPKSRARRGEPLRLWYDTQAVHLFHPETGENLTERA
ncbi:sn-glycerol-3-phosphate ABC transporter ATP-binding protein UgpC [Nonomuraea sp. 3-1Str]|uniref:ABC transporter ATP-binding protein n=1 Tax=Nonomuraea sp. 3-1Str TaxID=2929801 RepID=UPI00285C1F21|nr:sn-glycerol-3-phosphate ABC transporter ATP-binding protein UgpC [Nonomuraea sp. 3-1Str]MDR8412000.1 sn-glycerol-3-phosphate ABC transporter ATP-binding protein UgpC [Nonomuraea sp. 3-1Str]